MSKKLFTLIYGGDTIHLAPGKKIIPADAFSDLLNVEEALERIGSDADAYKKEQVKECELLKEQAQQEGFEEGFRQWNEQILALEQEIEGLHDKFQKQIAPLALQAAKKIVGRELELKPETVVDIILNTLRSVSEHRQIMIHVNPQELDAVESERPRLKGLFERLESLTIRARPDIKPGGCVIETERGIINGQLENQWQILEQVFSRLLAEPSEEEAELAQTAEDEVQEDRKL